jgi:hypothetical protein
MRSRNVQAWWWGRGGLNEPPRPGRCWCYLYLERLAPAWPVGVAGQAGFDLAGGRQAMATTQVV